MALRAATFKASRTGIAVAVHVAEIRKQRRGDDEEVGKVHRDRVWLDGIAGRVGHGGRGTGSLLYGVLIDQLVADPTVHRAYAGVGLPNDASVALHLALGFERVGSYHEVGFKFDRYWDVDWFEKDVSGDG